ncbi:hypothetical protein V1514DRAFT_324533 [Lipomyces japonicus]|uniref:uncharacterized protein n=1 Tax=Lipomyces japonicus TaxID=56871 RepID=UPI0034CD65C1
MSSSQGSDESLYDQDHNISHFPVSPSSPMAKASHFTLQDSLPNSLANEIKSLLSEYSSMLLRASPVPADASFSTAVDVRTKENTEVRISVSSRGWTVEKISYEDHVLRDQHKDIVGSTYEVPEAVLALISPAFAIDWQNKLIERLEMLSR